MKCPCRGFTLLELLVALSIFSVIAVMAYGGLGTVLNQSALTEENAERLAVLQKTYLIMQRDIEQAVPRAIRGQFGGELAPMTGTPMFTFTRGGWRNPLNHPRSTLQRVGYTLEDKQLIRHTWTVLDRAQDSEPRHQELLTGIDSAQVRFLDEENDWKEQWPPDQVAEAPGLPRAVEVTLEHERFGPITWLFQLPE
jgi:general secretion pathway protein J